MIIFSPFKRKRTRYCAFCREKLPDLMDHLGNHIKVEEIPKKCLPKWTGKNGKTKTSRERFCSKECAETLKIVRSQKKQDSGNFWHRKVLRAYRAYGGSFYTTFRWLRLREEAFKRYGRKCARCGVPRDLQVDHVQARSSRRERQWDMENLQILCRQHNLEKSNVHSADYRLPDLTNPLFKKPSEPGQPVSPPVTILRRTGDR